MHNKATEKIEKFSKDLKDSEMKAGFYILESDKKTFMLHSMEEQLKRLQASYDFLNKQNKDYREMLIKRDSKAVATVNASSNDLSNEKDNSIRDIKKTLLKKTSKDDVLLLKKSTFYMNSLLPLTPNEMEASSNLLVQNDDKLPMINEVAIGNDPFTAAFFKSNEHPSNENKALQPPIKNVYDLFSNHESHADPNNRFASSIYVSNVTNCSDEGIFNFALPKNPRTLKNYLTSIVNKKESPKKMAEQVFIADEEIQTDPITITSTTPDKLNTKCDDAIDSVIPPFLCSEPPAEIRTPTRQEIVKQIKKLKTSANGNKIYYEHAFINEFEKMYKERKDQDEEIINMRQTIIELTEENEKLMNEGCTSRKNLLNKSEDGIENEDGTIQYGKQTSPFKLSYISRKTTFIDTSAFVKRTQKFKYKSEIKKYTETLFTNYKSNSKKYSVPLKTLLKLISNIFNELLKKYKVQLKQSTSLFVLKDDFCEIVYMHLHHKYGNKNFAMRKYSELVYGGLEQIDNPSIHLFLGCLGMTNDVLPEDINFYMRALSFIKYSKAGVSILHTDPNMAAFIPYIRAIEFVKVFFENGREEVRKKCEKLKLADPKKINTGGIIELDPFLITALDQHRFNLGKMKNSLEDIFHACDFDCSNYIEYFEFSILFKYVEPKRYDYITCRKLFDTYSETAIENGQPVSVISFNQFAELSQYHKLFSETAQIDYINCKLSDKAIVWFIKDKFSEYIEEVESFLDSANVNKDFLGEILKSLRDKIMKDDAKTYRSTLMIRHCAWNENVIRYES